MDMRQRIAERLENLGKSTRGASIDAGLGETTLRNYLKGMTQSMTVDNVEKLASVLEVSPRWLMFGEDTEVVNIWDRIPLEQREQAKDILKTFAKRA